MGNETCLEIAQREFRQLKTVGERAMGQLDDAQFFANTGGEDNSVAVIVKHMAGNLRSRWTCFLTSDGEKPDRHRDNEFVIFEEETRPALMDDWENGWRCLLETLAGLADDDLNANVRIRGESLSVRQAIARQLTHYAYHVGQIVVLAKHAVGARWKTLSVPRGGSASFNARPRPYLEEKGSADT